jgi:hypothetical protein
MLDLTKPMQTRHGYPARLIYDKHQHEYGPLVFAIRHPEGVEKLGFRDAEGRYPRSLAAFADFPSDWDIINAPIPDNMVIVTVERGMAAVTQVPDGVAVKVMDYDVDGIDEDALIRDEHDKLCRVELFGPAGPYHVWPFA